MLNLNKFTAVLCFPNCKINLGLFVTSRRADGFHNLETVFYPVGLTDVLEIVPAEGDGAVTVSGLSVACEGTDNLVWKAYVLMRQRFPGTVPALDIFLHKTIPMGAGLGGGSADGAFMLRLIADFCRLDISDEQLAEMALELGSDCPFFIYNAPRFATGRGEILEPVDVDLSGYDIQLICPQVHVSTAKAFGMLQPKAPSFDLRKLAMLPVKYWKGLVSNDFERAVFEQHPELADIKEQLYEQGAIYASMSGSGSAVYGIFEKGNSAVIESPLSFGVFHVR